MSQQMLERLLGGRLPDPDGGGLLSVPIRSVVIGSDLARNAAQLVTPLDLGKRLTVVMDATTKEVMGEAVAGVLRARFTVDSFVFGESPHPDMDAVAQLEATTGGAEGLVAVGSGSINDITRHAAHRTGKPYAVFGTAPSMNGYTSVSAAITENGLKKSLSSTAARGVFLDLDILSAAPRRLIAAGFGDSICRPTAQFDWLLAHRLFNTPYLRAPFDLLAKDDEALVASAADLAAGDRAAVELLARTLVMSGFGMTICGGSYPASQSEHLIAHYIDMLGADFPPAFHGEHIAVTTCTVARLQERMLALPRIDIHPGRDTSASFAASLGQELGASCWNVYASKHLDASRADALSARLDKEWPEIRSELAAISRPALDIVAALRKAGAPVTPGEVGIAKGFYREALLNARKIRDRFGVLDYAEACRELEPFVADEIARTSCERS